MIAPSNRDMLFAIIGQLSAIGAYSLGKWLRLRKRAKRQASKPYTSGNPWGEEK